MSTFIIWHNPRCSKSREGLKLIRDTGVDAEIRKYLDSPPTEKEIRKLLEMMGIKAMDLMRRKEKIFRELGLGKQDVSEDDLIHAMSEHPRLIERPILIAGDRAILGRPPERLLEIL